MLNYNIIDNEPVFEINDTTRVISCAAASEIAIIQFDHNSERFTFRLNKFVEGHDVTKCNKVEVHYKNIDALTREETSGIYTVDDLQPDPEDETKVSCTWLISQNATGKVGKLNFLLRFSSVTDDGTIEYAWNTAMFTGIVISPGMYNSEEFENEYYDVVEKMKNEIFGDLEAALDEIIEIDNKLLGVSE